jgi:hypothetical protein
VVGGYREVVVDTTLLALLLGVWGAAAAAAWVR